MNRFRVFGATLAVAVALTAFAVTGPGGGGAPTPTPTATATAVTCDRTAATGSALTTQFAAATAGQTICLTATADYGTFTAGAKSAPGVTITTQSGVTATISFDFTGATNVTVDGTGGGSTGPEGIISGVGAMETADRVSVIDGASSGIVLRNIKFRREMTVNKSGSGSVVIDHSGFGVNVYSSTDGTCVVCLYGSGTNGVFSNSTIQGFVTGTKGPDGVRADGDDWEVAFNHFIPPFVQASSTSRDELQICCGGGVSGSGTDPGPGGQWIHGNWFDNTGAANPGVSQLIGIHDSAHDVVIEDNLFTGTGNSVGYPIQLRSDEDSVIRNNTMQRGSCQFSIPCGTVILGHKTGDDNGTGTRVYNNVYESIGTRDAGQVIDHNLASGAESSTGTGSLVGTPTFAGPTSTRAGWCITAPSGALTGSSTGGRMGITTGC